MRKAAVGETNHVKVKNAWRFLMLCAGTLFLKLF